MNYDPLSRGYESQGRIEEGYAYNPAAQQHRFHPEQSHERPYAGAILGASAEKQRQQGGVAREIQHFEKHLNSLISVIDELDRRLAVATVPQPETNNSLAGADQSGSALTCQLSSFNNMLSRQINRLEAIYQGVDL
jgi:hypothetical protein